MNTYVIFNYLLQVYIDTKHTDVKKAGKQTEGLNKLELSEQNWDVTDADWANKHRH